MKETTAKTSNYASLQIAIGDPFTHGSGGAHPSAVEPTKVPKVLSESFPKLLLGTTYVLIASPSFSS